MTRFGEIRANFALFGTLLAASAYLAAGCGIWGQIFCDKCWDGKYGSSDSYISGAKVTANCTFKKDSKSVYFWGTDSSTDSSGNFRATLSGASNYFGKSSVESAFMSMLFKNSDFIQGKLSGADLVECKISVSNAGSCSTLGLNDGTLLTSGAKGNGKTASNVGLFRYENTRYADVYVLNGGSISNSVSMTPATRTCPSPPSPPPKKSPPPSPPPKKSPPPSPPPKKSPPPSPPPKKSPPPSPPPKKSPPPSPPPKKSPPPPKEKKSPPPKDCDEPPPPPNKSPPPPKAVNISHDPHLVGAHGTHYDFSGLPDKSFCLLTDRQLVVNMKLSGYLDERTESATRFVSGKAVRTWIREVGIVWSQSGVEEHKLRLVSREGKESARGPLGFLASAEMDSVVLPHMQVGDTLSLAGGLILSFQAQEKSGPYDVDFYSLTIDNLIDMDLRLRVANPRLQTASEAFAHFSIGINNVKTTPLVHGVLGQTYRDGREERSTSFQQLVQTLHHAVGADSELGKGFLDGKPGDYLSTDVLSADCKFSGFAGKEMPTLVASE